MPKAHHVSDILNALESKCGPVTVDRNLAHRGQAMAGRRVDDVAAEVARELGCPLWVGYPKNPGRLQLRKLRCKTGIKWHTSCDEQQHRVVAIKAVAHKLARACYHVLHEGTTFDLTRAFG